MGQVSLIRCCHSFWDFQVFWRSEGSGSSQVFPGEEPKLGQLAVVTEDEEEEEEEGSAQFKGFHSFSRRTQ